MLSGPVTAGEVEDSSATVMTVHTLQIGTVSEEQLDKTQRSFWEFESFGIEPLNDTNYDYSTHITKLTGGRHEVSLPWKDLSLGRLKELLQRLNKIL